MSNAETSHPILLVTGASGHLGRRVIELLLEAQAGQASHIIAATRTPEKLRDLAARGVTVRYASFDEPASLAQAFAGVDRLLLISTDAVGQPRLRITQHKNAVQAAEAAGVRHIVYTSITNPDPANPAFVVPDHAATEAALEASKLGYTSLRNNLYMEVLLGNVSQALQRGSLYSAAGDGKAGYVTREDCARAAAGALADTFYGRRVLDVTGPEAVSHADVAVLASKLSGKNIPYVALPLEALVKNMIAAGLPEPMAHAYSTFDAAIASGQMNVVSTAVQDLSGHKPTSAADFIAANQASLTQQPAGH